MNLKVNDTTTTFEPAERWTVAQANETYDVARWGRGYFSVSEEGHVLVHPGRDPLRSVDLKKLIDTLVLRGIDPPILLRFGEALGNQLLELKTVFAASIAEHNYQGGYRAVYPIKVNQQRQVVEEVYQFGREHGFGLEAGSKPELLAVIAIADNDTPIICNGFKDDEYIEMVMLAKKVGRQDHPGGGEVHRAGPDSQVRRTDRRAAGDRLRVKLASRGAGRWKRRAGTAPSSA